MRVCERVKRHYAHNAGDNDASQKYVSPVLAMRDTPAGSRGRGGENLQHTKRKHAEGSKLLSI